MIVNQKLSNLRGWIKLIKFELHNAVYEEFIRQEKQLALELGNWYKSWRLKNTEEDTGCEDTGLVSTY